MAGTAGAGRMAPPTSTRISARMRCVLGHFSPVKIRYSRNALDVAFGAIRSSRFRLFIGFVSACYTRFLRNMRDTVRTTTSDVLDGRAGDCAFKQTFMQIVLLLISALYAKCPY